MSDYMLEAGVLIQRICSAVNDGRTRDAISIQYALLAHIERGRVPDSVEPAAWAVSGQDLSDYSLWHKEPAEWELEIMNDQCKDGPIIVRPLFFAAPAAPDHSAISADRLWPVDGLYPDMLPPATQKERWMFDQGRLAERRIAQEAAAPDHSATVPTEVPMPEEIERLAVNRYRCVPTRLLGYKVVAGDGSRALFEGTKDECYVVARKLTEAFLDGAHVACEQMQQYGDAREAAGYARGMAEKGGA